MTADPVSVTNPGVAASAGPDRDAIFVVGNVLGIVSIVFGVVAALLGFIPFVGLLALLFAFVGGLWAALGLIVLLVGKRGSIKLPLIGLGVNGLAFFLCLVVNIVAAVALSNA